MTKPVVEVLLSTFNAGEYLTPLLESVWSQEGVDVRVHVRDDDPRTARERRLLTWPGGVSSPSNWGAMLAPARATSACWRRPGSTAPTLPSATKMIYGYQANCGEQ